MEQKQKHGAEHLPVILAIIGAAVFCVGLGMLTPAAGVIAAGVLTALTGLAMIADKAEGGDGHG